MARFANMYDQWLEKKGAKTDAPDESIASTATIDEVPIPKKGIVSEPSPPQQKVVPTPNPRVAAEVERFLSVAVPYPDGRGWYDPTASELDHHVVEAINGEPISLSALQDKVAAVIGDDGLTAVERAADWRSEWARSGYPPGVTPCEPGEPLSQPFCPGRTQS